MYEYRIDDLAVFELQEVDHAYVSYFARLGNIAKGIDWATRFFKDYYDRIDLLRSNPYIYGKCLMYPFNEMDTEYHSFQVGWFTVFYTIEEASFTVWHIRSSQSDFSDMR